MQSAVTANANNKITYIKGSTITGGNYKVTKNSKFINNGEKINQKLNYTVLNQLKKDNQAHGVYSLNPFAFYPKNLKTTIQAMMSD